RDAGVAQRFGARHHHSVRHAAAGHRFLVRASREVQSGLELQLPESDVQSAPVPIRGGQRDSKPGAAAGGSLRAQPAPPPGGASATETTLPTDSFDGTESILAYYGQLELPIVRDRLRLVGGLREEHSRIQLNTEVARNDVFCKDNEAYCAVSINLDNDNLLP